MFYDACKGGLSCHRGCVVDEGVMASLFSVAEYYDFIERRNSFEDVNDNNNMCRLLGIGLVFWMETQLKSSGG